MIDMDCAEVRDLLHPYADNELPPQERRAVAVHLGDCPACAQALSQIEALRQQIGRAGTHALPAGLEARVRRAISSSRGTGARRSWGRIAGLAASHAAAAVLGAVIGLALMARVDSHGRVVDEVVAAHVRSLVSGRAVEIASADPHVIRPWFAGKVTYAPPARDLAGQGFPLEGARVDYVPPQAVAAIVYGRRLHRITLFVLPGDTAGSGAAETSRQGYNVVAWRYGGFTYYAVSDLNRTELETFAKLMRSASTPSGAAENP
jgi:anti-sigma factor RsiW